MKKKNLDLFKQNKFKFFFIYISKILQKKKKT